MKTNGPFGAAGDSGAGGGAAGSAAAGVGAEIAANLRAALARVEAALAKAGRPSGSARLVAVSKTKPVESIEAAARAGQIDFGENYAQEAAEKIARFPSLRFHFIGRLQSNKAKLVVGRASLIHSVDREKLAREISALASARGARQDALIQLHIGDEETKAGATLDEALAMARLPLPGLRWRGVMCLPPLSDDESVSRGWFRQAQAAFREIKQEMASRSADDASAFGELSMGTTGDFEAAIAEGATLVRVGTAIFGERER